MKEKYNIDNTVFSAEFLREGKVLFDNLCLSRIIAGENGERAKIFANLLKEYALKDENFFNSRVIRDLDEFKMISDIVIVKRLDNNIKDKSDKIHTRDLFARDLR